MADARQRLLDEIDAEMSRTAALTGRRRLSPAVREAMATTPRDRFVGEAERPHAWEDRPLPIGAGQTISQPYIVALMVELLDPEPGDVMLDVGTGCGYAAAVLARIVAEVHSVEVVPSLAESARRRLARLGVDNVVVHEADGHHGWPEAAPYDGIQVAAAAPTVPEPLVAQLGQGARMVLPLGRAGDIQQLAVVTRGDDGTAHTHRVLPVAFVPLVPGAGGAG